MNTPRKPQSCHIIENTIKNKQALELPRTPMELEKAHTRGALSGSTFAFGRGSSKSKAALMRVRVML